MKSLNKNGEFIECGDILHCIYNAGVVCSTRCVGLEIGQYEDDTNYAIFCFGREEQIEMEKQPERTHL